MSSLDNTETLFDIELSSPSDFTSMIPSPPRVSSRIPESFAAVFTSLFVTPVTLFFSAIKLKIISTACKIMKWFVGLFVGVAKWIAKCYATPVTDAPIRSPYSMAVHVSIISVTAIAGIFVTEGVTKAVANGAKVTPEAVEWHKLMVRLYQKCAIPYLCGFFLYFGIPKNNVFWCTIRILFDEVNIALGFACLVFISASYSTVSYLKYMTCWFAVTQSFRLVYLGINQFVNFMGREQPVTIPITTPSPVTIPITIP